MQRETELSARVPVQSASTGFRVQRVFISDVHLLPGRERRADEQTIVTHSERARARCWPAALVTSEDDYSAAGMGSPESPATFVPPAI